MREAQAAREREAEAAQLARDVPHLLSEILREQRRSAEAIVQIRNAIAFAIIAGAIVGLLLAIF
jgi:hypothetical protein